MRIIGGILCAFGALTVLQAISNFGYSSTSICLIYCAIGAILLYAGASLIEKARTEKTKGKGMRTNTPERSCLDCRYRDKKRDNIKAHMIYCKWDDTYYYPETGFRCDDYKI